VATRKIIGVIGAGPMAIYLLKHLIGSELPLRICIYEQHTLAGTGMPYRQEISPDYMLANIFSREIPQIQEPLADWLRTQPDGWLDRWGLAHDAISARAFYPRSLLGAYLVSQLQALVVAGIAAGHDIEVRTNHEVVDIQPMEKLISVLAKTPQEWLTDTFDTVVLTTGHTWDAHPKVAGASLVSPWPASNIAALAAGAIGILGSSLSAVDVAVALAHIHGSFTKTDRGLNWKAHPGSEAMTITMVSKTGILPEADFYYPYPYDPLVHLTDTAVEGFVADGAGQILARTFDLLIKELKNCDPAYLDELGMGNPTVEAFGGAYFARRQRLGAFRALQANLVESRATIAREQTIAWRYALLRGHEVFEAALAHVTQDEWQTFRTHLLPVFADCYAAVPHLSLDRLEAMRAANVLEIAEVGDDAEFLAAPDGGVIVRNQAADQHFTSMVDARGQASALPSDLPFPTLVKALENAADPVQSPFRLALRSGLQDGIYCLSMPQVLVRYPFSQGLPNCDALSVIVAAEILTMSG